MYSIQAFSHKQYNHEPTHTQAVQIRTYTRCTYTHTCGAHTHKHLRTHKRVHMHVAHIRTHNTCGAHTHIHAVHICNITTHTQAVHIRNITTHTQAVHIRTYMRGTYAHTCGAHTQYNYAHTCGAHTHKHLRTVGDCYRKSLEHKWITSFIKVTSLCTAFHSFTYSFICMCLTLKTKFCAFKSRSTCY